MEEEEEHQFLVLMVLVVMSLICDYGDINYDSASARINMILVKMTKYKMVSRQLTIKALLLSAEVEFVTAVTAGGSVKFLPAV